MRIHTIEHVPFEGPAGIAAHAATHGHPLHRTRLYAGDAFPALDSFDLLAVMGGPMSVHDTLQFPWLAREKTFLRQAVDAGRAVLGICLGAQLLAESLGGAVTRSPQPEIGWHPVTLTPDAAASPAFAGLPSAFTAFHWHGETFSIPPGATHLASSAACAHQAFAVDGRLVGLQFHFETTAESMERLITHCAGEIIPGPHVHTPDQMRAAPGATDALRALPPLLDTLLRNMALAV
ncbi:MAG: type 1 glutamine amidotransferase [Desulfovibrionaceae bacterium]